VALCAPDAPVFEGKKKKTEVSVAKNGENSGIMQKIPNI
jgi:hypothetical protein